LTHVLAHARRTPLRNIVVRRPGSVTLDVGTHRLRAAKQSIATEREHDSHAAAPAAAAGTRSGIGVALAPASWPIVATMTALIVWTRFSASSNTIERGDSKTSSVTSRASSPKCS